MLDEPRKRRRTAAGCPLLGVISLRDLILAPRHARIRDLMETDTISLRLTDDQETARRPARPVRLHRHPGAGRGRRDGGISSTATT
ncbi:MAG: hypothetical protein U0871_20070 [Gemmataceae bacterium]